MILTTFYYHLLLWNFALNGPPEAADDPYLHLGVALEATLGIRNFWVFLIQLTFPSMGKVVSFLLEFLRILGTTGGCTVGIVLTNRPFLDFLAISRPRIERFEK